MAGHVDLSVVKCVLYGGRIRAEYWFDVHRLIIFSG